MARSLPMLKIFGTGEILVFIDISDDKSPRANKCNSLNGQTLSNFYIYHCSALI